MYILLIGKVMYLVYETRPDIVFVISQLNRHNSDHQVGHLHITKQVLKYLKRTITLDIKWGYDFTNHY